jgi:aspartate/methionine/tyrosine aminotransferase
VDRRTAMLRLAAEHGLEAIPPEGAFYALVRLPAGMPDSLAAAGRLLDEQRVLTVPGVAFGAAGEGWLRVSWVAEEATLAGAFARMGRFFRGES